MAKSTGHVKGFDVLTQRPRSIERSRIIDVVERDSPLVVSIPHSGTWIPQEALSHIEHSRLLLIDTDMFTQEVYKKAAELGSSVTTHVNPYVTNMNRGYTKPELPIIPQQLLSGQATLLRAYTPLEKAQLLSTYYVPYHSAIVRLIKRAVARYGFALIFDGHAMDRHGMVHTKDPGEKRTDMVVGDNHGRSAHPSVSAAFEAHLRAGGFEVHRNKPYAGGHITKANGAPDKRVHALQLELVKELYMYGIATPQELGQAPLLKKHALAKLQQALQNAVRAAIRAGAVAIPD